MYIRPVLARLHWLPVTGRIQYKIALLTFKTLTTHQPSYIHDLLQPHCSPQKLRFASHNTHPFNGPLFGTAWMSRYQKDKTNLDFTEARDSEWQWYQLGHMQVCISLQTDNHASTPQLSFYRPDALPVTQPTVLKH